MTKSPDTPESQRQPTPSAVAPCSAAARFAFNRITKPRWWVFIALYVLTVAVAAFCGFTLWIAAILLADDFSSAGFIVACALAAGTGAMARLAWRMLDLAELASGQKPNTPVRHEGAQPRSCL